MTILAIDPGITTGVAIWDLTSQSYSTYQLDCRDLDIPWFNFIAMEPSLVGYEDFKYRPNLNSAELYSKEVIGVIRLYQRVFKKPECFKYLPSRAKAFWTDEKVKSIGLWKPGQSHAMDALRVLLTHRGIIDQDFSKEVFTTLGESLSKSPAKSRRPKSPPKEGGPSTSLDPLDFE